MSWFDWDIGESVSGAFEYVFGSGDNSMLSDSQPFFDSIGNVVGGIGDLASANPEVTAGLLMGAAQGYAGYKQQKDAEKFEREMTQQQHENAKELQRLRDEKEDERYWSRPATNTNMGLLGHSGWMNAEPYLRRNKRYGQS